MACSKIHNIPSLKRFPNYSEFLASSHMTSSRYFSQFLKLNFEQYTEDIFPDGCIVHGFLKTLGQNCGADLPRNLCYIFHYILFLNFPFYFPWMAFLSLYIGSTICPKILTACIFQFSKFA